MIIRKATDHDAQQMTDLLNAIILKGGTTAYETPFSADKMIADYINPSNLISCHVADDNGICGFQRLTRPDPQSPFDDHWAIIATFVADGMGGKGIGKKLFAANQAAARAAKIKTIDATIRADNISGLGYYNAMGFVDYDRIPAVPLKDGTLVDRIQKRFDL